MNRLSNDSSTFNYQFNQVYHCTENPFYKNDGVEYTGEFTKKTQEEMKSQEFVDLLNSNAEGNADWNTWKIGESGYPELK